MYQTLVFQAIFHNMYRYFRFFNLSMHISFLLLYIKLTFKKKKKMMGNNCLSLSHTGSGSKVTATVNWILNSVFRLTKPILHLYDGVQYLVMDDRLPGKRSSAFRKLTYKISHKHRLRLHRGSNLHWLTKRDFTVQRAML